MLKRVPTMISSTVAVALSLPVVVTIPSSSPKPSTTGELPPHHEKGYFRTTFRNPWDSYVQVNPFLPSTLYQMYKEWVTRPIPPPELLPKVMTPTWGKEDHFTEQDLADWRKDIKSTWLGHACFLVEFPCPPGSTTRGPRVLFDPCFDDRCSPSQYVGPKRVTQPPFKIEEMPEVDIVVVSHNHWDHLSQNATRQIYSQQPKGSVHFFAPLGNKAWFESNGIAKEHCTEMDWWDERDIKTSQASEIKTNDTAVCSHLRLTCTPAQHFSGRSVHDRFHTLWSSWAVTQLPTDDATTSTSRVWFGGDTGYKSVPKGATTEEGLPTCPAYKEIGAKLGPFDFSMIPIGAYDPRFFMSSIHLSPEDAVEVHKEVRSLKSMGMHFATWVLTCEEMTEPPKRLRAACDKNGISASEFGVCGIGETTRITPSGKETDL